MSGEFADLDALESELAQKGGAVVGINAFTLDGDEGADAEAKEIPSKAYGAYQNLWFDSTVMPAALPPDQAYSQRPMSSIRTGTSGELIVARSHPRADEGAALIEQALATSGRNPRPV